MRKEDVKDANALIQAYARKDSEGMHLILASRKSGEALAQLTLSVAHMAAMFAEIATQRHPDHLPVEEWLRRIALKVEQEHPGYNPDAET
jgi:hypothetical protein